MEVGKHIKSLSSIPLKHHLQEGKDTTPSKIYYIGPIHAFRQEFSQVFLRVNKETRQT